MPDPVGYVGDADLWCESCAAARFGGATHDHEGNEIGALFEWDESGDTPDCCGGCGVLLGTSWSPNAVRYALSEIRDAVDGRRQRNEVLDEWAEHLTRCGIDKDEMALVERYQGLPAA